MALKAPAVRLTDNIVEKWLDTLDAGDRAVALECLEDREAYGHKQLAKWVSSNLGQTISENAIRGWRDRHP